MKKKYPTIRKKGLLTFFLSTLFCVSIMAQVDYDKVRTVPTVEGDASTEFLFLTHLTDSTKSTSGQVPTITDELIENVKRGAYVEYQIISYEGGDFLVTILAGTKKDDAMVNVGVYKTLTESWPDEGLGDTVAIENTNNWNGTDPYYFPITLEANVYYNLRINFINTVSDNWICNVHGISVAEQEGSIDATLSDLKVDGTTIEGFDPNIFEYTIFLDANTWINSIEATTNDPNATAEVPEDLTRTTNAATYTITVTSEAGIPQEYTLKVVTPTLVDEGIELALDDVAINSDASVSDTKINSLNNGAYVEYYVYSNYKSNFALEMTVSNGYVDPESYLNVSIRAEDDSTWTLNELNSVYVPTTYNSEGATSWDATDANILTVYFSLEANEPVYLRIYSITNVGNCADIHNLSFKTIYTSIDASLKDLTIDGATLTGFDPTVRSYSVAVPKGTTSVSVGAETNDAAATITEGIGTIEISGFKTTDSITVTSETGNTVDYLLNLYTPVELTFDDSDTLTWAMSDSLFYSTSSVSVTNSLINYYYNEEYVEYYIYSESDLDLHMIANMSNGNADSIYGILNVSTYTYGDEWNLDPSKSVYVPHTGESWVADSAREIKFNLSLTANEPVILRLYSLTNGTLGCGDIQSLRFVTGETDFTAIESAEINNISVFGGTGSVTISCDESYVGGSVLVYDTMGRLIMKDLVDSTREVYNIGQRGFYIVKVVSPNNNVTTTKCYIK